MSRTRHWIRSVAAVVVLSGATSCGASGEEPSGEEPSGGESSGLGRAEQPFVNGADDRLEFHEVADPARRRLMAESVVALMYAYDAQRLVEGELDELFTFGQRDLLCPGERFEDQPAAAYCTGVLADWDLVLTAGHCLPGPVEDLRVVFGYYYGDDSLALEVSAEDVYSIRRVVTSRRDPETVDGPRLDYAWLELTRLARPPLRPAPVHVSPPDLPVGSPIVSVGSTSGVPLKLDDGARIRDRRESMLDYFVADTDTSGGWSGGPAFDAELNLLGNLARGEADFYTTDEGCNVDARGDDPAQAQEQFNYAHRAVEGLCASGFSSDLCDSACQSPCRVGEPEADVAGGGCALVAPPTPARPPPAAIGLGLLGLFAARRSMRRRTRRRMKR